MSILSPTLRRFSVWAFWVYLLPLIIVLLLPRPIFTHHFRLISLLFAVWAVAVLLFAFFREHYSLASLGISTEKLLPSIFHGFLISVLIAALLASFFHQRMFNPRLPKLWFLLFYPLLSCPAQEFLYRGLLTAALERAGISKPWALCILTALFYSLMHIPFVASRPQILFLTFGMGLMWEYIYLKTRNLAGVTISHIVLGFLSVLAGIA